jgi:hypothetical protein
MKTQISRPGKGLLKASFDNELIIRSIKSGMIMLYPSVNPPVGWITLNGSEINRVQYGTIFAIIGTSYGAGNGTTTFNVPSWTAPSGGIYIMKV